MNEPKHEGSEIAAKPQWYRKAVGAVLAAGAGAIGLPQESDAAIIYYDKSGDSIATSAPRGQQSIYFSLTSGQAVVGNMLPYSGNQGSTEIARPEWTQFIVGKFGNFGAVLGQFRNNALGKSVTFPPPYPGPYPYPFRLNAGAAIGPGGQFVRENNGIFTDLLVIANSQYQNGYGPNAGFAIGGSGYLGLRFSPNNDNNFYYGWAHIQVGNPAVSALYKPNMILLGMAYNDEINQPIAAGAVPEPASTTLLILGAAGIAGYRAMQKRRKEKLASASSAASELAGSN